MGHKAALAAWHLVRAGELKMDPGTLSSRAKAFAAAIPARDSVTLLVQRTDAGILSLVLAADRPGTVTAVQHLAAACAAQPSPADLSTLDLSAASVGRLVFQRGSTTVRDTQVGADLAGLAQVLGRALTPGGWVAATVRTPTAMEQRRHVAWLQRRLDASTPHHHSNESNALVMTLTAGSSSRPETVSILSQVAAAMPGFDLPVRVDAPRRWSKAVWGAALSLAAGGAAYAAHVDTEYAVLAAVPVLAGTLMSVLTRTSADHVHALRRALKRPASRVLPPKAPGVKTREDGTSVKTAGDYPLAPGSFMVGAHLPASVVAPHSGGLTGAGGTLDRVAPSVVTHRIGPLIGVGPNDQPVHLSAQDSFAGTVMLGRAGSGKSVAVRQLFAWHLLDRKQPSGVPGAPGNQCAVVAIEAKRDGARQYLEWAQATGVQADLIDVMDPTTWAIDLTPPGQTLELRARGFVSQMQYAFGEDAIAHRSFATLVQLAMGAMVVDDVIADTAGLERNRGVMYYMAVLVEAFGEEKQLALAGSIISEAVRREAKGEASFDLVTAREYLRGLFDGRTASQRRTFTDAPSSKLQPLLALDSWWRSDRPRVSWEQILSGNGVVIINTGAALSTGDSVDDTLSQQLQAMMMFSLKATIEKVCAGWDIQGRSVAIFSDELSLLAGNSPEVVTWLRDQGRSYGVHPFFALQYPDQLEQRVRTSVLGFSALMALTQDNTDVAIALAKDFSADGTQWDASDVVNLPKYTAIARVNVDQQRQPAFTVKLTSWEDCKGDFAAAQGYAPAGGSQW